MDIAFSKLADWVVPLCLEQGLSKTVNAAEAKKITAEFQDYLSCHEEYNEFCTRAEEIDFCGLKDYISNNMMDDLRNFLTITDAMDMEYAKERILDKAYSYSKATTREERERVLFIISNCLEIFRGFYRKNISFSDMVKIQIAAKATADQVFQTISANYGQLKQEEEKQHRIAIQIKLVNRLREAWEEEFQHSPSTKMTRLHESLFPNVKYSGIRNQVKIENDVSNHYPDGTSLQEAIESSWSEGTPKNISLYGIGGLGKTASLLSMRLSVLTVYIPLRALSNTLTIEKYILDTTLKSDHELYNAFMELCNRNVQNQPNVLLVLDGLNEIDISKKNDVKRDISNTWARKQAQIVISSRYDSTVDFPWLAMLCFRMELLSKEQIEVFLKSNQLPLPVPYSRLWHVLNTPLMLNLYTRGELIRQHYQNIQDISLLPAINAGAIIWNYLQSEILRSVVSFENPAVMTVAAEYAAPRIAYEMQAACRFSLRDTEMIAVIEKVLHAFQTDSDAHQLPWHVWEVLSRNPCEITAPVLFKALTEELCIFVRIEDTLQFMHQHFRDALAALHFYNSAQTATDQIPDIWLRPIDQYVSDFLTDFFVSNSDSFISVWSKLWTLFQSKMGSLDPKIRNSFIERMLELYKKAYGPNISRINFSGFDLSDICLLGYQLDGSAAEHFEGTKITARTICGNGHRMMVCSLSWDSGNSSYLSASHDCALRIWDTETQESERINSDNVHKHYIRCAQWCPGDDNLIASAGDDKQVFLWTNYDGCWTPNCLGTCGDWIYSICWNSQGNCLFCGDRSGSICEFSVSGEKRVYRSQHTSAVGCISCASGELFATGDDDGVVCIWELENTPKLVLHFENEIKAIQWANHDRVIAVFTNTAIYYLNYQELINNGEYDWWEDCASGVIWSKHEQGICTAVIGTKEGKDYCAVFFRHYILITEGYTDANGKYQIFQIVSKEIQEEELGIVSCAIWDHACTNLIIGSRNGSIWESILLQQEDTFDRLLLKKISDGKTNSARCSVWSRDGAVLAAGYDDGKIRIWDVEGRRCVKVLNGHSDSVKCLTWESGKDNPHLAAGSDDGSITIWDTKEWTCLYKSPQILSPVNCIVWTENGRIMCGTDIHGIFAWDRDFDGPVQIDTIQEGKIYSMIESMPGRCVISAGNDKRLYVWELGKETDDVKCIQQIESGHTDPIRDLVLVPEKCGIVSAANDGRLLFRFLSSNMRELSDAYIQLQPHHHDFIYSVTLTGNWKYIISGSTDSSVGVWDASLLKFLTSGKDHDSFVWDVSASPAINNAYYIASASSDGTLRIWDVSDINASDGLLSVGTFEVLANISLVDCDFSKATIEDKTLLNLIVMNGGIIKNELL